MSLSSEYHRQREWRAWPKIFEALPLNAGVGDGGASQRRAERWPRGRATIKRRFTNIWKNEGGTWRLFARHANVIPKR